MSAKRRQGRPVGETIGGIIVGFDQQIMRTLPPPHELVLKGAPVRGLTGEDADLVVVMPGADDDDPVVDLPAAAPVDDADGRSS